MPGLGRLISEDHRDLNFPMKAVLPKKATVKKFKYWNSSGWQGDQGETSQCVGYSWAGFIESGPIMHKGKGAFVDPTTIYNEAQKVDEWPGEDYDGTSVRAGAKYLQSAGFIGPYTWAFDIETMVHAILTTSPVVVGTNWYNDMFEPNKQGVIKIGGGSAGGHAWLVNGVHIEKKLFRMKNSWGSSWGLNGQASISFEDMEQLIVKEQGECCLAIEIKK